MKFKIGFTEQSKGWTASVNVEGDNEEEALNKAKELANETQKVSQMMTLQKLRSLRG